MPKTGPVAAGIESKRWRIQINQKQNNNKKNSNNKINNKQIYNDEVASSYVQVSEFFLP